MENLISPWRLPPQIRPEVLAILRPLLSSLIMGAQDLGLVIQRLHPGLLEDFRRHRLTPWLFQVIARYGLQKLVGQSVLEALRADYARALGASALEGQEIRLILQALAQAGVEVILFKGAELRLRLYQDAAVRPLADVDLLIPAGQMPAAALALEESGFRLQAACADPRPGFRRRFRRELHFDPPAALPLVVDLHWQVDYPDHFYPIPYPRLAREARVLDYAGQPVKVPCPEHAYLLMLLHACDGFHGLMHLVDFALAPHFLPVAWDKFLGEVGRLNLEAPVYLILREIARQVAAAVPLPVLTQLSGYPPTWVEKLVLRRTLGELTPHFVSLYRHRAWRDRLFYLGAVLWPQPEYLRTVYGTANRGRLIPQLLKKLLHPQRAAGPQ